MLYRKYIWLVVFWLTQTAAANRLPPANVDGALTREEEHEPTTLDGRTYYIIGVSGGLQDGFPDHVKMDYHAGEADEVPAVFIGRALVRGCRAYLDVMQEGWRQYTAEPAQPMINSVVLVSGCWEHANQYWIYAIDARQFLTALNNEPRFLSITPDTGLVDLTSDATDAAVKHLAFSQIRRQSKTDTEHMALPIVVATWYHESFVPSPWIRELDNNGTLMTNFPDSLAQWAGVDDADRTAGCDDGNRQECDASPNVLAARQRYWDGIRKAVRWHEGVNRPSTMGEWKAAGPPFACHKKARLGVSAAMARINYAFSPTEIASVFAASGFNFDFTAAAS